MKKITAVVLLLGMILALAACGGSAEGKYKLGLGIVASTEASSSEAHVAQVDATVAAVVLDREGRIAVCRLDCLQNRMDITDGLVDPATSFLSNAEQKDAAPEWCRQAAEFESYVVGKTPAEVAGIKTVETDDGSAVAADEALYSLVSLPIADFKAAIAKACKDEQGMSFTPGDSFTLGLACCSFAGESVSAGEEDGFVRMYTEFAAVVLDGNGRILANLYDVIRPEIAVSNSGEILRTVFKGSERELKETDLDSPLAWYQQAANFENYAVGRTAEELGAVETEMSEEGYPVFADDTLYASVSIRVDGMIAVLLRAIEYAR